MKRNVDTILKHYLYAVLFTEELDDFDIEDIDNKPTGNHNKNSVEQARLVVETFLALALPLLTEEWTDEQVGHDIWLTRNRHGAGFWDRDLPNGDKLTEIALMIEFHGTVYEENGTVFIDSPSAIDNEIDLSLVFENYEMLPQNVQDILMQYQEDENDYDNCQQLVDALEEVGYTCDYYLDAEPYHLRYKG